MSTVPYLSFAEFRSASIMPSAFIDQLETAEPGWLETRLLYGSAKLDSRLGKRYDAPFRAPYPIAVCDWLARVVTYEAWLKRGLSPTDQEGGEYRQQSDTALAEIKEAADSEKGLFELPLRADTDAQGVTRGSPRVYSETSPYIAFDQQACTGHREDTNGCC
jgi:hypothetical protein